MNDPYIERRRRLGDIARDLAVEMVTADVDPAQLDDAIAALEGAVKSFRAAPRFRRDRDGHLVSEKLGTFDEESSWDFDAMVGPSNPLAPPMRQIDETRRHWVVTFGYPFEGHPGLVHGGFVAAALDHVLGCTASTTEGTSMTGTLTTRFRKPTPAHVELACRGRVDRVEGRKVFCSAEMLHEDTVVAEAEGVFFRFEARVPGGTPAQ